MADISLIKGDGLDDSDEGMFEQGDGPTGSQIDDETLPPLLRVQKYAQSEKIHDRQMVWRILMDLFRSTPPDTMTTYLPLIMNVVSKLADEGENIVRTDLLEQIPNLAAVARNCSNRVPALRTIVGNYLLPMVVRNLGTEDGLVRKTAQSALFSLMEHRLVSKQEAEAQVCPIVLMLSKEEKLMDYHNGAITLMSKMAPLLGREVTERMFLKRFSQLCMNDTFYVRKVCASHFGDFCAVVGKEAYEQVLLPRYIRLCSDDIWGVRKACAEVAMSVSCACPPTARRYALAPVFAKLLQDTSRWVRMSAFQTLGPFISTFADPSITNLFYNNQGDLVMVNNDGREFRVNSSTVNRSMLVKEDEWIEDNVVINPLSEVCEDPMEAAEDKGGTTEDIVLDYPTSDNSQEESERKREEIILQKNFQVVSKAMFGEVVTDDPKNDKENVASTSLVTKEESEDIKEIVETVKNAVLSFRNAESSPEPTEDTGVLGEPYVIVNIQTNSCDKLPTGDSRSLSNEVNVNTELCDVDLKQSEGLNWNDDEDDDYESVQCFESNSESSHVKEIKDDDDNLDLYNSYNYWYIGPPDIPVDLSVADDTSINKLPNTSLEDAQMNAMFKTFTLDDSVLSADQTYCIIGNEAKEVERDDNRHVVPQLLIDHFVSMTDSSLAQSTDNEMAYHCAYSLPAVALTLGSKNWHLIKDTVETLASDMQYKVRRTVASSLHELALILGPEIATNNLTPIFDGFLKDLDEVRIGVLKHLAHFLRLISPLKRSMYLPRLADFLQTDNELNWRFRQELAEQLLLAVPLFRPTDAAKHIANIARSLLCDKVAAVCQTALTLITELLRHISNEQALTTGLLILLAERFAHSTKWKRRQTFALLCSELLMTSALSPEQFANDIMPHLLDLSWDPVANVRLVVARTIARHIITNSYFADPNNQHYDSLQTVLRRLQSDRDRDVRHSAVIDTYTNPGH